MIYRKQTRTIKNTTETTRETSSISATTVAFALQTSDAFYVGFHEPFNTRYFLMGTANQTAATLTVKYWNGSDWTAVTDQIDQTLGFTQNGWISWSNTGTTPWVRKNQTGITADEELYWIQITTGTNLHASTTLQAVMNLFCDATLLRTYYPELVSDTRYLPPDRNDFMEQFVAAKDRVVLRLKQMHAISDEAQILDINEVAVAATHAAAHIILFPITKNNPDDTRAADAEEAFNNELNLARHSFDLNQDGEIDEPEEDRGMTFNPRW